MNEQSVKSNVFKKPLTDPTRCQHSFPSGRRCRMPVSDLRAGVCAHHFRERLVREEADLSTALVGELKKFETAGEVNDVLSRLLILVSQGRVSPRRAAVMAYICNLLLRSVPKPENEPPEIIFDAPRPDRSHPDEPQPSSTHDQVNART
jgi:hypothetical protein